MIHVPCGGSSTARLVWLYLAVSDDGESVEDVRDGLGLSLLTLYPVLERLESEGYIERDGETVTVTS